MAVDYHSYKKRRVPAACETVHCNWTESARVFNYHVEKCSTDSVGPKNLLSFVYVFYYYYYYFHFSPPSLGTRFIVHNNIRINTLQ